MKMNSIKYGQFDFSHDQLYISTKWLNRGLFLPFELFLFQQTSFISKLKTTMEPLTRSKIVSLKKQLNFEYAFRPIYTFSRITGLWPFSIIHDSKGEIYKPRVGFFDILRTVFIICLNLTLIFFQYKRFNQEKFETKLPFAVLSLFKISSLLTGTFGIVFDLINRNMLINILRKFNIFDNEVRDFSMEFFRQIIWNSKTHIFSCINTDIELWRSFWLQAWTSTRLAIPTSANSHIFVPIWFHQFHCIAQETVRHDTHVKCNVSSLRHMDHLWSIVYNFHSQFERPIFRTKYFIEVFEFVSLVRFQIVQSLFT